MGLEFSQGLSLMISLKTVLEEFMSHPSDTEERNEVIFLVISVQRNIDLRVPYRVVTSQKEDKIVID